MSVRYKELLEKDELPMVIEEHMSSQEGEYQPADNEDVQMEKITPEVTRKVHLVKDMSIAYKRLLEQEKTEDMYDDATTEKKPKMDDNCLESQETRRMNKLEISPLDISPRSEQPLSPYESSDNESNYSSVPSERVAGDTNSIVSYASPNKAFDPIDGENIESTLRTSHSSPTKVQRPQYSNLNDKLKMHDYVVDERQNLVECFQTY